MKITTRFGLKAMAATTLTLAAVTATTLAATPASAAPAAGESITVTLHIRPDNPRGFGDSYSTSIIGTNGYSRESSCDYLDAGPVTTKTVTARVGEQVSVMQTAGCYLLTNESAVFPVTATTSVIDVAFRAIH